jgi:hypothetical protein
MRQLLVVALCACASTHPDATPPAALQSSTHVEVPASLLEAHRHLRDASLAWPRDDEQHEDFNATSEVDLRDQVASLVASGKYEAVADQILGDLLRHNAIHVAEDYIILDEYIAYAAAHPDCERDVTVAQLRAEGRYDGALPTTIRIARDPAASRTCVSRALALHCELGLWIAGWAHRVYPASEVIRRCSGHLHRGGDLREVLLVASAVMWPRAWDGPDPYLVVAELAGQAFPEPDAFVIAKAGLANYAPAVRCAPAELDRLRALRARLGPWSEQLRDQPDTMRIFQSIATRCRTIL